MIVKTFLTLVLFEMVMCAPPTQFKKSLRHGGGGGNEYRFECPYHGAITGIKYRSGDVVNQLEFICTSWFGKTSFGPYGSAGGSSGTVICPQSFYISSIYGKSGQRLDRLGIRCRHESDMTSHGHDTGEFGGSGGGHFDDVAQSVGARPISILVRSGDELDGLEITYGNIPLTPLCTNCTQYREEWAPKHGGSGGQMQTFVCPEEGVIIGITYRSGQSLDLIQFRCSSSFGETTMGPYGSNTGSGPFTDRCEPGFYISSLHGRSSSKLDQFGIRCIPIGHQGIYPKRHGHGGNGGDPFDDESYALRGQRPIEIRMWIGGEFDAIQVKYGNMPVSLY